MPVLYNPYLNRPIRVPDSHPDADKRVKHLTEKYHKTDLPDGKKRHPQDRWLVDETFDERREKTPERKFAEEQSGIDTPQTRLQAFLEMTKQKNDEAAASLGIEQPAAASETKQSRSGK